MGQISTQIRADLPFLSGPMPGPRARAIIARDQRVISPSYTRGYPLVAERGEGAIVRMSMATGSSISTPVLQWSPQATATRESWTPFRNRLPG